MKDTGPSKQTRVDVVERDGQRCRRCGKYGNEIHHRTARQHGGTKAEWINGMANLVLLCSHCHQTITENPADAYVTGWSLRRMSLDRPDRVPVVDVWGYMALLTDDGGVQNVGHSNARRRTAS